MHGSSGTAEETVGSSGGSLLFGSLFRRILCVARLGVCGVGFGLGTALGESCLARILGSCYAKVAGEHGGEFLAVEEEGGFDVVGVLLFRRVSLLYFR